MGDLFSPNEQWEIRNVNGRWGSETYDSREDAEAELRSFWKGVSGVNLEKFEIVKVPARPDAAGGGDGD